MQSNVAVIDVGSNSVRLMLVANGKVLYKRTVITRLGEGLASTGRLQAEPIRRTVCQIAAFCSQAKTDGADKIYAYATAAVRSAVNRQEFLSSVQSACGLSVEVLSGDEEALVGIAGALGKKDGGVLDIGGASTELILQKHGEPVYRKSVDVGVVRLYDICGRDREKLESFCKGKALEFFAALPNMQGLTLCGIGGTATTLAAVLLGQKSYDGNAVTGKSFSVAEIRRLTGRLFQMSEQEIASIPCVEQARAQVLTGGAAWLNVLTEYLGISSLTVSDCDNLEGYAKSRGLLE